MSGRVGAATASVVLILVINHTVILTWAAPNDAPDVPPVTGYNVYRGTINGGPYTLQTTQTINALDYNDLTVASGATYYYVVTAVNANGESALSNQATAVVP